jgi:hypothetical protein
MVDAGIGRLCELRRQVLVPEDGLEVEVAAGLVRKRVGDCCIGQGGLIAPLPYCRRAERVVLGAVNTHADVVVGLLTLEDRVG